MKSMWLMVLAAAAAWGQSVYTGGSTSSGGAWGSVSTICGPPLYPCSSASLTAIQLPNVIPNVGNATGAGTVITPSDFNNPIARITDGQLDVSNLGSAYQIDGGSDNLRDFNTDSSLIMVKRNSGSEYLMSFNTTTMASALLYSFPSKATDVSFSGVNPKVVFSLETAAVKKYDFTSGFTSPTITIVHDWGVATTNCPAVTPETWHGAFAGSVDDKLFGAAFSTTGGQGTGVIVALWSVTNAGCRMVNTGNSTALGITAGTIVGDYGSVGTMLTTDRFTLHETLVSPGARWVVIEPQICQAGMNCGSNTYFWDSATTSIQTAGTAGHHSPGYNYLYNGTNSPPGQIAKIPFDLSSGDAPLISSTSPNNLPNPGIVPLDIHTSAQGINSSDSTFIWQANTTWNGTQISALNNNFTGPYVNEIMGYPVGSPGSATALIKRFAHCFISTYSTIFEAQQCTTNVSQDARFAIFTSDWMGTLGNQANGNTCNIGGPNWLASFSGYTPSLASVITPVNNNNGHFNYQIQSCSGTCTTGSAHPTWAQDTTTLIIDNTITWKGVTVNDCRSDVFVVKLQ